MEEYFEMISIHFEMRVYQIIEIVDSKVKSDQKI